jgi:hypothetical protein
MRNPPKNNELLIMFAGDATKVAPNCLRDGDSRAFFVDRGLGLFFVRRRLALGDGENARTMGASHGHKNKGKKP